MSIRNREFSKRRKELIAQMEAISIALLASAPPRLRNNDAEYQYRQNSDFYYLTGFTAVSYTHLTLPTNREV